MCVSHFYPKGAALTRFIVTINVIFSEEDRNPNPKITKPSNQGVSGFLFFERSVVKEGKPT
jgi:hypothetical protein